MICRSLAAVALLLVPAAANAADWEYMGAPSTLTGGFAVDAATVTSPTPSTREASVIVVLREDSDGLAAIVARMTIDCPTAQKKASSAKGYDARGNLTLSEGAEAEWFKMEAGTPYGNVRARVCDGTKYRDPQRFSTALPIAPIRALLTPKAGAGKID